MRLKEIVVVGILFALAVGFTVWYQTRAEIISGSRVCFEEDCFFVEIADENAERMKGLMNRTSMDADRGMLFIWEEEEIYSFWMKDTLIPLDMIWLNKDKE